MAWPFSARVIWIIELPLFNSAVICAIRMRSTLIMIASYISQRGGVQTLTQLLAGAIKERKQENNELIPKQIAITSTYLFFLGNFVKERKRKHAKQYGVRREQVIDANTVLTCNLCSGRGGSTAMAPANRKWLIADVTIRHHAASQSHLTARQPCKNKTTVKHATKQKTRYSYKRAI